MHILIVRNNSNSQAIDASLLLVTYLTTQGIDYTVVDSSKLASPLAAPELCDLFEHGVDMAVALGGDGTILRTARQVGFHGTPILGINYGRLGFLANPNEAGVMEPLVAALSGDAAHEVRTNLDIRVVCEGEADPYADDGAGADEANARHHLGPQPGHIGVVVQIQVQELAGEGGHGRPQADQDMGAEACGPALVLPLQPDETAAHHRQQHPQRGGQHGHIPHTVKNRQQRAHLPQISSMAYTLSSSEMAARTRTWRCRLGSRMENTALGFLDRSSRPRSRSTS